MRAFLRRVLLLGVVGSCASAATAAEPFLTFVQSLHPTDRAAEAFVSGMVVSPDGRFLYIADTGGDAIRVHERDETTGLFEEIAIYRDWYDGMTALDLLQGIGMSPDGAQLYVTSVGPYLFGQWQGRVAVLGRDAQTGALVEEQVVTISEPIGVIVVAPDGADAYALAASGGIASFGRDPATGALTWIETVPPQVEIAYPLDLSISADGLNLYRAASWSTSAPDAYFSLLDVYSRDPATGAIAFVESHGHDEVPGVQAVSPSADGASVYAALTVIDTSGSIHMPSMSGHVVTFDRDPSDGTLTLRDSLDFEPAADVVAIGDSHVYVAGNWCSYDGPICNGPIASFPTDPVTGELGEPLAEPAGLDNGQAQLLAPAPDGSALFAWGRLFDTSPWTPHHYDLAQLDRDGDTGALTLRQALELDPIPDEVLKAPSSAAISPDGKHLYVPDRREHFADDYVVRVFSRNAVDGSIEHLFELPPAEGPGGEALSATLVVPSPDGAHLYVNSSTGYGWVAVYERDPATGDAALIQVIDGAVHAITPDGRYLYAGSTVGFRIFARDAATGILEPREGLVFGEGELAELSPLTNAGTWVALSPDGAQIYTRARVGEIRVVASLSRDVDTGELALLETDPIPPSGLGCCRGQGITVSADGRHVYSAVVSEVGIAVFDRDPATGRLAFRAIENAGSDYYLMSPHPRLVLSYGVNFSAWERDPSDGSLTPLSLDVDPEAHFARSLSFSPRLDHLYQVTTANGLFVFAVPEASAGALGVAAWLGLHALRSRLRTPTSAASAAIPRSTPGSGTKSTIACA